MSKRPYGATSQDGKTASVSEAVTPTTNGLPPINELLTPSEEPEHHEGHVKKPRNFIATVVIMQRPASMTQKSGLLTSPSRHARIVV
jgi:hypothetical protein